MSVPAYQIVEPHPSATSTRLHSGRGGAGNVTRVSQGISRGSDATGPPSRISLAPSRYRPSIPRSTASSSRQFTSGRGGVGNTHHASERAIFSFDEELASQLQRSSQVAPVYHVGRGGAGNVTDGKPGSQCVYIDGSVRERRKDSETASARSTSSVESGADVMTRNMKNGLRKGWGKVVGVGSYMTG